MRFWPFSRSNPELWHPFLMLCTAFGDWHCLYLVRMSWYWATIHSKVPVLLLVLNRCGFKVHIYENKLPCRSSLCFGPWASFAFTAYVDSSCMPARNFSWRICNDAWKKGRSKSANFWDCHVEACSRIQFIPMSVYRCNACIQTAILASHQGRLVDAKSNRQPQCESVVYAYSNQISKKKNAIVRCCTVNAL